MRYGTDTRILPFGLPTGARTGAVVMALLLATACQAEPNASSAGTDDTAMSLLASTPTLGSSGVEGQAAVPSDDGTTRTIDISELGYNFGSDTAVVRVIELSDFGCGFCRKFHIETWPAIEKEFIETGMVQWKYVPYILGIFPNAIEAANAGECAGEQGKFVEMRERLFVDQNDWKRSSEPNAVFRQFAREEGLDLDRFTQCIDEGRRNDRVEAGTALGRQVGVRGTPTFFVVGYAPLQGALDLKTFREILTLVHADQLKRRGEAN